MNTDHCQVNGSAAEHIAAAAFLLNGWQAYHQDHESGATDMVVENGGSLQRVQVRSFYWETDGRGNRYQVAGLQRTGSAKARTAADKEIRKLVDLFCFVDLRTLEVYMVASHLVPKTRICKGKVLRLGTKLLPLT